MSGDVPARFEARTVSRVYPGPRGQPTHALGDVSLAVPAGSLQAVVGPSGCGKTTLLRLIAGLDRPSTGEVLHDGVRLSGASEAELTVLRRRIGLVFQDPALLPRLRVWENVAYPLIPRGVGRRERRDAALAALERLDVAALEAKRPEALSGGERQRVGVARAIVAQPDAIVADEPTVHLDEETADGVIRVLRGLRDDGLTLVVATHGRALVDAADAVLELAPRPG